MRLFPRPSAIRLLCASCLAMGGCVQATQTYPLPWRAPSLSFAGDRASHGALAAAEPREPSSEARAAVRSSGDSRESRPVGPPPRPLSGAGVLSVERIEGGQRLFVLQLDELPPPERIAPGLRAFVVWLKDPRGREVNLGTLRYDRANRSGNLLATTDLTAFTVRVTGERDGQATRPRGVLLAERRVVTN